MTQRSTPSWVLILALYVAGLCGATQYAKFAVPFSALEAAYPTAGATLGWLISLLSLLGLFLGVIAGGLVARIGFRRCLIWALWAGAVLSALQSFMPPLPVMMALRVLEGASHLAIVVAAPTLIAQTASDRARAGAMTLWGSFFGVAFALTAFVGLPFIAANGLATFVQFHAVACFAVGLILWALLPKGVRATRQGTSHSHLTLYRSPWLAAPGIGWLFYTLTFVAFLAVLPDQLAPDQSKAFATFAPLAGIVISLTFGTYALRHFSAVAVVVAGFALSAIAVPFLAIFAGLALPGIVLFAALGLVQGASFAAVPQLNENQTDRALANGAMAQMGNAGNLIGTPIMLMAIGVAGTGGMLVLAFVAYLLAIGTHLGFAALRRRAVP